MAPRADHPARPIPPTAGIAAGTAPDRRTRRRFLGDLGSLGVRAAGLHAISRTGLAATATPALASATSLLTACADTDRVAPTIVALSSPDHVLVAGRPQRIPLAIVAPDSTDGGAMALPDDDQEVVVTIDLDGDTVDQIPVRGRVVDHDHVGQPDPGHQHAGRFRYYPVRTTLPTPGIYDMSVELGGTRSRLPIQAFDPAEATVPLAKDPFPVVPTPTAANPDGVDPLCTRFEPCPFHQLDAADLVGGGRPFGLLVATPAYCSSAYCGPALETLIEVAGDRTDLDVVHVEVYANPAEVGGNITDPAIRLAPAVERLGLTFEPSLFLVAGDGIIVDRLDAVFDRRELDEAIADLFG